MAKRPARNIRYKSGQQPRIYVFNSDNNGQARTLGKKAENKMSGNVASADGDVLVGVEHITSLVQQMNCLDIKRIADICVSKIPELIDARFASLYVLDESSDILHLAKCNHPFEINNIVSLNQTPPSPMVTAVRSKELLLIEDIDAYTKPVIRKSQRPFSENYQTKSCIIAPLICQGRVVGVLNLADKVRGKQFGQEDVTVVELFRHLVGASVGNIKLFEKTQRQANTDGLTGLVNHRMFYEILEKELRRSQRYGGQISVIMADIDNLKPINDTFGHRAGDMAIRQISRKITECIRQIDTAARYGGDEFAVILPSTSLTEAVIVAQRTVRSVANSPLVWEKQQISLSISIGVGQYESDTCPEDIANCSDEALYLAKQAGKNTVKIFEPSKVS